MLIAFAVPLAFALALAFGDEPVARFVLHGKVLDPTRAPVSDARVTAISSDRRVAPTARTDARGEFELALAPGRYTLTVRAAGFRRCRRRWPRSSRAATRASSC